MIPPPRALFPDESVPEAVLPVIEEDVIETVPEET
jgi:hypothetical protein